MADSKAVVELAQDRVGPMAPVLQHRADLALRSAVMAGGSPHEIYPGACFSLRAVVIEWLKQHFGRGHFFEEDVFLQLGCHRLITIQKLCKCLLGFARSIPGDPLGVRASSFAPLALPAPLSHHAGLALRLGPKLRLAEHLP